MGSRSRETGTQWYPDEEDSDFDLPSCFDRGSSDSPRVGIFFETLPRAGQLRESALSRFRYQKKREYFNETLDDLISVSEKAEQEEEKQQRLEEKRENSILRPELLNSKRFTEAKYTESRLSLPLPTFLKTLPQTWREEAEILEAQVKHQQKLRLKLKPVGKSRIYKPNLKWEKEVQMKLQEREIEALTKSIDRKRKSELRREISDFDLLNRPAYHMKTDFYEKSPSGTNPMDEMDSPFKMYANLPNIISQESFETVTRKEQYTFSEELLRAYESLSDPPKEEEELFVKPFRKFSERRKAAKDAEAAAAAASNMENESVQAEEAVPETNPLKEPEVSETGETDIADDVIENLLGVDEDEATPSDTDPDAQEDFMENFNEESQFGLDCLRDLVDIAGLGDEE